MNIRYYYAGFILSCMTMALFSATPPAAPTVLTPLSVEVNAVSSAPRLTTPVSTVQAIQTLAALQVAGQDLSKRQALTDMATGRPVVLAKPRKAPQDFEPSDETTETLVTWWHILSHEPLRNAITQAMAATWLAEHPREYGASVEAIQGDGNMMLHACLPVIQELVRERLQELRPSITLCFSGLVYSGDYQDYKQNLLKSLHEQLNCHKGAKVTVRFVRCQLGDLQEEDLLDLVHALREIFACHQCLLVGLGISHEPTLETLPEALLQGLTDLQELDIAESGLVTLDVELFTGLPALQRLVLRWNALVTLPKKIFHGFSSLQELALANNRFKNIPESLLHNLSGLQKLDLSENPFKRIPVGAFRGLTNLTELDLPNTGLTELPDGCFAHLSKLRILNLCLNSTITKLNSGVFSGLTNLRTLWLERTGLQELSPRTFQGLANLRGLDLSETQLVSLPAGVFDGLTNLQELILRDNNFAEKLPATLFQGLPSLKSCVIERDCLLEPGKLTCLEMHDDSLSSL